MHPPLVVDLDGTLIYTDMLHESALKVFRETPWTALLIPVWLARGKAVVKSHLAHRSSIRPDVLPYNEPLLHWLHEQKQAGRRLVLCTASDQRFAEAVADHLGLFDAVLASDGERNLSGPNKAQALCHHFGEGQFDYAGNSSKDLPVWQAARKAVVVNAAPTTRARAEQGGNVEKVFPQPAAGFSAWLRALRVHQWLKNLLLFFPALLAHEITQPGTLGELAVAFLAFSLCASSVYIANDLVDLESDRIHPRKRLRPFAAGTIPAWQGVLMMPVLLLMGIALAAQVNGLFMIWLGVYFVLTCAYSFGLKRLMLVDCLTLAMLYTLRMVAGAAASDHALTFWLLAESMFLFLSLAFIKRYAELHGQQASSSEQAHGRGYITEDAPLVQMLGVSSGFTAVLVMALYLNLESTAALYQYVEFAWAAIPFMLFWISWMWMQASRGRMHDDPLLFALTDKVSLVTGVLFATSLWLASSGLPW